MRSPRYCTDLDLARAQVSKEAARVQFEGPAVVHVEFMVDQVAWRRSFCAACNEIKTAPFSRAPGAV